MEINRSTCCTFTGHRPEKLTLSEWKIKALLSEGIDNAVADGYDTFITGMARGVDIWAAEAVLKLKENCGGIKLICAIPHPGFEKRRPYREIMLYRSILAEADKAVLVSHHFFTGCYQIRNEWMVDRSSRVIAVCSGLPSGTKNTVTYANGLGIDVINLLEK